MKLDKELQTEKGERRWAPALPGLETAVGQEVAEVCGWDWIEMALETRNVLVLKQQHFCWPLRLPQRGLQVLSKVCLQCHGADKCLGAGLQGWSRVQLSARDMMCCGASSTLVRF